MDKELMALREIVAVMGPKVPSCCQGCEWEWGEALRIATAAIAQREPDAESQWRTMESAPKDGTVIFLWVPDRIPQLARADDYWHEPKPYWLEHATHWMPLPAQPEAT